MELDSLPDLSSNGIILDCTPDWRWIFTLAVTSIFPFNPNLGDQIFSSMSTISTISILEDKSSVFSPLDLGRKLSRKLQFPLILKIKILKCVVIKYLIFLHYRHSLGTNFIESHSNDLPINRGSISESYFKLHIGV